MGEHRNKFEDQEGVNFYVAFDSENSHCLHNLTAKSPADGWTVIYVGDSSMNASIICDVVEK